jgi:hypothetical protein
LFDFIFRRMSRISRAQSGSGPVQPDTATRA